MPDNKYNLEDILAEYGRKEYKAQSDKNHGASSQQSASVQHTLPTGTNAVGSAHSNHTPTNKNTEKSLVSQRDSTPAVSGSGNKYSSAVKPASGSGRSKSSHSAEKKYKPDAPSAAYKDPADKDKKREHSNPVTSAAASPKSAAAKTASSDKTSVKSVPSEKNSSGHITDSSPLKERIEQRWFLFKQLVHRDFTSRYKGTFLGVIWSMLSPMLMFAVQAIIFSQVFGRKTEHYITYLITGNVVFHYFSDAANAGMFSMSGNGGIISKLNVPKWLFLLSKNVSCAINFGLTLIIIFVIAAIDGIIFHLKFFALVYPILWLTVFNIGLGMVLSALHVFFRDIQYFWSIITQVLMYFSAIFYRIEIFDDSIKWLFYLNPVYSYITYFRTIIIDNTIPDMRLHMVCAAYAVLMVLVGLIVYKKNNKKFVYYF